MDYQWKEADNRKRKEGMEKERRGMSYLSITMILAAL